jgi:mono/diheme cytochrome c family protein
MKKEILVFLFIAALGTTAGCRLRGSEAMRDGEMEGMTMSRSSVPASHPSSPVRSISLPHDEAFAPPGPGRAAFVTDCVVCHSPRYITDQPPFSREVWTGIVQKMIDAYGAHITPAQASEIVDYLTATNGAHLMGGEHE